MQKDCPRSRLTVDEAVKLCALLIVLRLLLYSAKVVLRRCAPHTSSTSGFLWGVRPRRAEEREGGIGGPEVGRA